MRGSRRAIAIALCIAAGGFGVGACSSGDGDPSGGGSAAFDRSVDDSPLVALTRGEHRFQRRLRRICQDANVALHPPVRIESYDDRARLARRQLSALERFAARVDSLRVPNVFARHADEFLAAVTSSRDVTRQLIDKAADGLGGEVGLLIDAQHQYRDMRATEAYVMGVEVC